MGVIILPECQTISIEVEIKAAQTLANFGQNATVDNRWLVGVLINTAAKTQSGKTVNAGIKSLVMAGNNSNTILKLPEYMVDSKQENFFMLSWDTSKLPINWTQSGIISDTANNWVEAIFYYMALDSQKPLAKSR